MALQGNPLIIVGDEIPNGPKVGYVREYTNKVMFNSTDLQNHAPIQTPKKSKTPKKEDPGGIPPLPKADKNRPDPKKFPKKDNKEDESPGSSGAETKKQEDPVEKFKRLGNRPYIEIQSIKYSVGSTSEEESDDYIPFRPPFVGVNIWKEQIQYLPSFVYDNQNNGSFIPRFFIDTVFSSNGVTDTRTEEELAVQGTPTEKPDGTAEFVPSSEEKIISYKPFCWTMPKKPIKNTPEASKKTENEKSSGKSQNKSEETYAEKIKVVKDGNYSENQLTYKIHFEDLVQEIPLISFFGTNGGGTTGVYLKPIKYKHDLLDDDFENTVELDITDYDPKEINNENKSIHYNLFGESTPGDDALESFAITLSGLKPDYKQNTLSSDKTPPSVRINFGQVFVIIQGSNASIYAPQKSSKESKLFKLSLPQSPFGENSKVTLVFVPVFNGMLVYAGDMNDFLSFSDLNNNPTNKINSIFCPYEEKISLRDYLDENLNKDISKDSIFSLENKNRYTEPNKIMQLKGGDYPWDKKIKVGFLNCSGSLLWSPVYFYNKSQARYYFQGSANVANSGYWYQMYPIWHKNRSDSELFKSEVEFVDGQQFNSDLPYSQLRFCEFGFRKKMEKSPEGYKIPKEESRRERNIDPIDEFINYNNLTAEEKRDFFLKYEKQRFKKYNKTRRPPQLFGFVKVETVFGKPLVQNSNGDLINFDEVKLTSSLEDFYLPNGEEFNKTDKYRYWSPYIKSISVSHQLDGFSGTLVLDRYGMESYLPNYNSELLANQKIGQVSFDVVNTKKDYEFIDYEVIDTKDLSTLSFYNTTCGPLLRGFAYGSSVNDSPESNDLIIQLFGLEKKLQEIRLINSPYFDGRYISEALRYLADYGNFQVDLSNAFIGGGLDKEPKLPISQDINAPNESAQIGTSVWEDLQKKCMDVGHLAVPQTDGKIWIYVQDEETGFPITINGHRTWKLPSYLFTSSDLQTTYDQFFNKVAIMGFQNPVGYVQTPEDISKNLQKNKDQIPLMPLWTMLQLSTYPNIPWEKLAIEGLEKTYSSLSAMQNDINKIVLQATQLNFRGNITIPANFQIKLFDTVTLYDSSGDALIDMTIISIQHDIDLMSKQLSTKLELTLTTKLNDEITTTNPFEKAKLYKQKQEEKKEKQKELFKNNKIQGIPGTDDLYTEEVKKENRKILSYAQNHWRKVGISPTKYEMAYEPGE